MKIKAKLASERLFLIDFCHLAILAGGAVRDHLLEKPVRDYDFYIEDVGEVLDDLLGLGFRPKRGNRKSEYDDPNISAVVSAGNFDVVLVKTNPVKHVQERFCTDFCKAWASFSKEGEIIKVYKHDGFDSAVSQKLIRVDMCAHLNPHMFTNYLPKLHFKYPEYRIELCWGGVL